MSSRPLPEARFDGVRVTVVVPAYHVEAQIERVLSAMPAFVEHIVVVDDASRDGTAAAIARAVGRDGRVHVASHAENQGVGGAMVTGFRKAIELGADIVVKMDGDGQMSPDDLPALLDPLMRGEADYAKGNRFRHFSALGRMPLSRRIGNLGLSFAGKAATGYWHCFDPTNGFFAIRAEVLSDLPLDQVHRRYFFEISLLALLYLAGAVIRDVPMPARYHDEKSSLSVSRALIEFPAHLVRCLARRIALKHFLYDFTLESLMILTGVPMLLFGLIFGGGNWIRYAAAGVAAPTGTIMVAALPVILGFQLLLTAATLDLQSVPRVPLCRPLVSGHADRAP